MAGPERADNIVVRFPLDKAVLAVLPPVNAVVGRHHVPLDLRNHNLSISITTPTVNSLEPPPGGPLALVGKAGHQENAHARPAVGGAVRQRDAVHHRHLHVGDEKVVVAVIGFQVLQGLHAVAGGIDVMPVELERPADEGAHRLVVLGQENTQYRPLFPSLPLSAW